MTLRTKYHRQMVGAILIPIFGGGALAMYFATKTNKDWMESYADKMVAQFEQSVNAPQKVLYDDLIKLKAQQFADEDENFAALLARFRSYLAAVSGEGIGSRRMAVDMHSGGRLGMMAAVYFTGFFVVPFMMVAVMLVYYVEDAYNATLGESISSMRHIQPFWFYMSMLVFFAALFYGVRETLFVMIKEMFGFVNKISETVLNTAPPNSFDSMYHKFLNEKIVYINLQWSDMVWQAVIILMLPPLVVGIALLDFKLLILSCGIGAFAIYMKNRKMRGEGIRVSDKGWVRYIARDGATTDFSLSDCDEVIVRYQSNSEKGVRVSSDAAMMRDVVSRVVTNALDIPELIPSIIIFYRKENSPVVLPLRFMSDESKDSVDSHQIEFFFALWLKERGFAFELQETDEMAGDWRAFRI